MGQFSHIVVLPYRERWHRHVELGGRTERELLRRVEPRQGPSASTWGWPYVYEYSCLPYHAKRAAGAVVKKVVDLVG